MISAYRIPVLKENNWMQFAGRLHDFPVRVSCFQKLESEIGIRDVGFKYVYSGKDQYDIGQKNHAISDGQYLVADSSQSCSVSIKGKQPDWGICVDLSHHQLKSILYDLQFPEHIDDLEMCRSMPGSDHILRQPSTATPTLNLQMQRIIRAVQQDVEVEFVNDVITDIAFSITRDQLLFTGAYKSLGSLRPKTRAELFQRMQKAICILRDAVCSDLSITELSREVALSEFRLYHLFKNAFGISPYQFLLKEKMEHALHLKKNSSLSWTEISSQLGFEEVSSFSRAFKKMKGVSPTKVIV